MAMYEIRLQGHLEQHWSACLGDLEISYDDDDNTVLRGWLVDQAALHGVLHQVRDLGVPLLGVQIIPPGPQVNDPRMNANTRE